MHDDLCPAEAKSEANPVGSRLFCWRKPGHPGDHWDRDHGIFWTHAPKPVTAKSSRRLGIFPPRKLAVA